MKLAGRLVREPLVHFLAIGGLIFVLYAALSGPAPDPAGRIVIGPERIERLADGFQSVWRRPPDDDELRAIIEDFVREEIYYREALALGLDRNDAIIRRRLRQKMEFLSDTGAGLLKPVAGELETYLSANEKSYRSGHHLSFEQVYLGETPDTKNISRSLRVLRSELSNDADRSSLGVRTMLPPRLGLSPSGAVDGVFGKGFFERLAALKHGGWTGPVESIYGVHLVRIVGSRPARTQPLAEIRGAVLRDWKLAKARQIRELHFHRLREHYVVEIRRADTRTAEKQ